MQPKAQQLNLGDKIRFEIYGCISFLKWWIFPSSDCWAISDESEPVGLNTTNESLTSLNTAESVFRCLVSETYLSANPTLFHCVCSVFYFAFSLMCFLFCFLLP